MDNFSNYLRDTAAEMRQVSWPTQKQAFLYTVLVIAISIIVAIMVGIFDFAFTSAINFIVSSF